MEPAVGAVTTPDAEGRLAERVFAGFGRQDFGVPRGQVAHGDVVGRGSAPGAQATSRRTLHATILHLLGLDHERLSYYHNGIERRLTDVHGRVIRDVQA
jgi:hypothetical protein